MPDSLPRPLAPADTTFTVGELLIVISTIVPKLQQEGLMDPNGSFRSGTIEDYGRFASAIDAELRKYLIVPAKIGQVISVLPLLLQLVGIRG